MIASFSFSFSLIFSETLRKPSLPLDKKLELVLTTVGIKGVMTGVPVPVPLPLPLPLPEAAVSFAARSRVTRGPDTDIGTNGGSLVREPDGVEGIVGAIVVLSSFVRGCFDFDQSRTRLI